MVGHAALDRRIGVRIPVSQLVSVEKNCATERIYIGSDTDLHWRDNGQNKVCALVGSLKIRKCTYTRRRETYSGVLQVRIWTVVGFDKQAV